MPENKLTSPHLKEALFQNMVTPLMQSGYKFITFRLMWSPKDVLNIDDVWDNLTKFQQLMSSQLMTMDGIPFFVTAVTATVSVSKNTRAIHPGLAFWVATNPTVVKEFQVFTMLRSNSHGASLKIMSTTANQNDPRHNVENICMVLKDFGHGFVKQKLDFHTGTNKYKKERLYMKAGPDMDYSRILLNAQRVLSQFGLDLYIETF